MPKGKPPAEPQTVLHIRGIPASLIRRLRHLASATDQTQGQIVTRSLRKTLAAAAKQWGLEYLDELEPSQTTARKPGKV